MFDIGFLELLVIFVLGLVVIGPERLPSTIKTCAIWFSRFKRSIQEARTEFEEQIGADEIRREIHNERVMESMRKFEEQRTALENKVQDFKNEVEAAADLENTNPDKKNPDAPVANAHTHQHSQHAENCSHCTQEESEPEPHAPMVQDEAGADASDLPGRTETVKSDANEEKHGKQ